MGFDAYVRCNCWKEGKTKPFPFDYGFHLSEDGESWEIDIPKPDKSLGEDALQDWYAKNYALDEWLETCCEHPGMKLVDVRIATVSGMSVFRWALEQVGKHHFPTLGAELPVANGGIMKPEAAERVMSELVFFCQQESVGRGALLFYSVTGEVIQIYNPVRDGIFRHHPAAGVDMGIDLAGFFIAKRYRSNDPALDLMNKNYKVQSPRQELFRAIHFGQRRIDADGIEYINADNGSRFTCNPGNGGGTLMYEGNPKSDLSLPDGVDTQWFHVVTRNYTHEVFRSTIQALIYVCRASIATGNPVVWY